MGKYSIHAGDDRPVFVIGMHLEKNSGQTVTQQGTEKAVYATQKGTVGFPNMTEAWGRRLDKDGKVPKEPLPVTSSDYTGKVEFMDWGAKGGYLIVSRYLSGYNTLDQQYQKLVLKADDRIKEDSDVWMQTLNTGLNEFEEKDNSLLIQHLKIHQYNRDSKSKDPNSFNYMFFEKNEELEAKNEEISIDAKFDAIGIVKEASKDSSLQKLYNVKRAVSKLLPEEVDDKNIYAVLLKMADTDPVTFLAHISEYKKYISNIFVKANAYKLLDLTKDGIIAAGKDSKEVIGNNIPAKGDKMLDYLLENCFDAESSKTILLLTDITEKIK